MEISNYTVVISSIVVMTGWVVNNILKRRDEIAKKRLEYRLETLQAFMPIYKTFQDSGTSLKMNSNLIEQINIASVKFQLYGYQDEIDILQKFLDAIKDNNQQALIYLNQLIDISKNRLRNELKLPKIK